MSDKVEHFRGSEHPSDVLWAADPGIRALAPKFLAPHSRILDLGTGNGRNAIYLAQSGHDVVGIDTSENQLMRAYEMAQYAGEMSLELVFEKGDMRKPSFEAESFDAVFITGALQELDNTQDVSDTISAAQSLVKPDGFNFVTAYIGSREEQAAKKERVILDPGKIEDLYIEKNWNILHRSQKQLPMKEFAGHLLVRSEDEIVAQKPV